MESGWTYGQVYDNDKKQHPNLRSFQSLPHNVRNTSVFLFLIFHTVLCVSLEIDVTASVYYRVRTESTTLKLSDP